MLIDYVLIIFVYLQYPHIDDCVPVGYEAISLLEALNGLTVTPRRPRPRRVVPSTIAVPVDPLEGNTPSNETVINVNEESVNEPSSTIYEDAENDTINEETTSESYVDTINSLYAIVHSIPIHNF